MLISTKLVRCDVEDAACIDSPPVLGCWLGATLKTPLVSKVRVCWSVPRRSIEVHLTRPGRGRTHGLRHGDETLDVECNKEPRELMSCAWASKKKGGGEGSFSASDRFMTIIDGITIQFDINHLVEMPFFYHEHGKKTLIMMLLSCTNFRLVLPGSTCSSTSTPIGYRPWGGLFAS